MNNAKLLLVPALVAVALVVNAGESFAAGQYVVDYRLTQWKPAHFHIADKAAEFQATLKQLGCETSQRGHNGHIDVAYRCAKWRKLTTNSHDTAHRWESWLKHYGFEARHQH